MSHRYKGFIRIKKIDPDITFLGIIGVLSPIWFDPILIQFRDQNRGINKFTPLIIVVLNLYNETVCIECIKVQIMGVGLTISIHSGNYGMIVFPCFKAAKGYLPGS